MPPPERTSRLRGTCDTGTMGEPGSAGELRTSTSLAEGGNSRGGYGLVGVQPGSSTAARPSHAHSAPGILIAGSLRSDAAPGCARDRPPNRTAVKCSTRGYPCTTLTGSRGSGWPFLNPLGVGQG